MDKSYVESLLDDIGRAGEGPPGTVLGRRSIAVRTYKDFCEAELVRADTESIRLHMNKECGKVEKDA